MSQYTFTTRSLNDDFNTRRQTYIQMHTPDSGGSVHAQIAHLAQGHKPDEEPIIKALEKMDARQDCSDFGLGGIARILYQFGNSPLLSDTLRTRIEQSVFNYKYWPSEPGIDSMCSWSENHYILFASGDYLMGQLYPKQVFHNAGQTGKQKMQIARPRIMRWLDLRYQTGFSEWLSNVYYEETLTGILNLVDFAQDPEIANKATIVLDLMLADMALNQFQGTFGSTHGRSYHRHKIDGAQENTGTIHKLMFGINRFRPGSMAAVALAVSPKYRMPSVLYHIANDSTRQELENRQRMSIRLEEAQRWGLDPTRLEDGMLFLTYEAMNDPVTFELFTQMLDEYNWWDNKFWENYKPFQGLIKVLRSINALGIIPWLFERDIARNTRPEVNIYTYRTPDYMLSSAQDYRKGYGGDQQHIWQATLGTKAVCFTTHPATYGEGNPTPSYWAGSGNLPRTAQIKNVAISLYDISTLPGLYLTHKITYTHAWLPKNEFDEIIRENGWIFARKNNAYLALWSHRPMKWATEGKWKDIEIIAQGKQNIWICELGRESVDGSFESFVKRIANADIHARGLHITYHSPSQGQLDFSWSDPLTQNGKPVALHDYPRYHNPYTNAPFPADTVVFEHNNHHLELNYNNQIRKASAFEGN